MDVLDPAAVELILLGPAGELEPAAAEERHPPRRVGRPDERGRVVGEGPEALADRVRNAGAVFVGPWSAVPAGDYATGANHVLPTGGLARSAPPLGIEAFGRWVQVQELTQDGLARIEPIVSAIARAEGLTAHAASVRVRLAEPDPDARPGAEGERPRVASGQPGAPGA